jgi:hypothetical protein
VESFFIVTGVFAAAGVIWPSNPRDRWVHLKSYLQLLVLCAVFFSLITWPLPLKFLGTDYSDLYSAMLYNRNIGEFFSGFVSHFGYFHVGAMLVGFCLAAADKGEVRRRAFFVLSLAGLTFGLFSKVQDFGIHHYYLLLQAMLLFQTQLMLRLKGLLYRVFVVLLALISFGTVFLPSFRSLGDSLLPLTPARRHAPLVRHDLHEIGRLIDSIHAQGLAPSDRVYVLSSSKKFNSDTLKWAEKSMFVKRPISTAVLRTHSVDKVDGFPEPLFSARYVVVADPIQYHLRPQDQRVVGIPAESILSHQGVGQYFVELPERFILEGDVRLHVFQRLEEIPEQEIRKLRVQLRRFYPDWSEESSPPQKSARRLWLEKILGISKFQHY